ncbi:MAG TPA: hypothetical protein VGK25_05660 [Ignavibacteria bacterium]
MKLINSNSLSLTLDNFNQAYQSDKTISATDKKQLASWLASRQGIGRSYAGMVSPTEYDYKNGVTLYTGEKIDMIASIGHIMGEEALRALYLLDVKNDDVQDAIVNSRNGLNKAIKRSISLGHDVKGTYCCGKCSAAYWRNLSAEGVEKNKNILNAGLKVLNKMRDGNGKWRKFPFHYTVLSLIGIDLPATKDELRYAEQSLLRIARRAAYSKYEKRRKMIAERALELIN